ncbi:hypothetical protein LVJ94_40865 [Pendulispora rubella]|uniref:Uncharacterized protein n=1 Tax=Pendulispora rubella TaxID=2741070 RepID=A0ABZ2KX20_9BACT
MQNRVFFPQSALDQWLIGGAVDLRGTELTIMGEARRYQLAEAVHVVREVTGSDDANDLVGRVKSKVFLQEFGAELLENSMILGDNAYDVEPGWLGAPIGTFDEHVASGDRAAARASGPDFDGDEPKTDEDLLARFLLRTLK